MRIIDFVRNLETIDLRSIVEILMCSSVITGGGIEDDQVRNNFVRSRILEKMNLG